MSFGGRGDGGDLRRVGGQRVDQLFRGVATIDFVTCRERGFGGDGEGVFGIFDQMTNNSVLSQLIDAIRQILPHEVSSEGERCEGHVVDDFEPGDFANGGAHLLQHGGNIDALFIAGQLSGEVSQIFLKVASEQFEQCGIELDVIFVVSQLKAGDGAGAEEFDGDQHQRCQTGSAVGGGGFPAKKAHGEEQCIRASFGQIISGAAIEFSESCGEFSGVEICGQFVALQSLHGELLIEVTLCFAEVGAGIPVALWIVFGQ